MEKNKKRKKRLQLLKFLSLVFYAVEVVLQEFIPEVRQTFPDFSFFIRLLVFTLIEFYSSQSQMPRILFLILSFWFLVYETNFGIYPSHRTDLHNFGILFILCFQLVVQYKILRSYFEISLITFIYIERLMFDLIFVFIYLDFSKFGLFLHLFGLFSKTEFISSYNVLSTSTILTITFFIYDLGYFFIDVNYVSTQSPIDLIYFPILFLSLLNFILELIIFVVEYILNLICSSLSPIQEGLVFI